MCSVDALGTFFVDVLGKRLEEAGLSQRVETVVIDKLAADHSFTVWAICPSNSMQLVKVVGEGLADLRMNFHALTFETKLLDLSLSADETTFKSRPNTSTLFSLK